MYAKSNDPIDRSHDEEREEPLPSEAPLDAAESTWDPWLRALYLRELMEQQPKALH